MGLGATTPISADRRTIGAGRTHWVTTMLPGTPTMEITMEIRGKISILPETTQPHLVDF